VLDRDRLAHRRVPLLRERAVGAIRVGFAVGERRSYLRNVVPIITEAGLRIYKEQTPTKKDQVDLENEVIGTPDSKTPNDVGKCR
jgi:hypothetical protein